MDISIYNTFHSVNTVYLSYSQNNIHKSTLWTCPVLVFIVQELKLDCNCYYRDKIIILKSVVAGRGKIAAEHNTQIEKKHRTRWASPTLQLPNPSLFERLDNFAYQMRFDVVK